MAVVCGAVVRARHLFLGQSTEVMACLERGVVPDRSVSDYAHHAFDLIYSDVKYPVVAHTTDMNAVNSEVR